MMGGFALLLRFCRCGASVWLGIVALRLSLLVVAPAAHGIVASRRVALPR